MCDSNIHKVELFIIDANGNYSDIEDIVNIIENRTDLSCKIKSSETKEFEWEDGLKINNANATIKDYDEYFKIM